MNDWSSDVCSSDRLSAKIKQAGTPISIGREARMYAIDVRWAVIAESVLPPHAPRDLSDDQPVGPRLTGQRQKGPLTADPPFRIGDGAVLFAPRRCGPLYMRIEAGVSLRHAVRHQNQGTRRQPTPHPVRLGPAAPQIGS